MQTDCAQGPKTFPQLIERFTSKIRVNAESGCWIWTASLNRDEGYGQFHRGDGSRRKAYAHRYAWEQIIGPIPDGKELDHLCRRPSCCNPEHLEVVTGLENKRRGSRTNHETCRRGLHAWIEENIHRRPDGRKLCRPCAREREQKRCRHVWSGVPAYNEPKGTPSWNWNDHCIFCGEPRSDFHEGAA